jgi:hypothetical protein
VETKEDEKKKKKGFVFVECGQEGEEGEGRREEGERWRRRKMAMCAWASNKERAQRKQSATAFELRGQ